MKDDLLYLLALSMTDGVGSIRSRHLVDFFGSAESVFKASVQDLQEVQGISAKIAQQIRASDHLAEAEKEMAWCERHDVHMISIKDEEYPYRLLNCPDPPLVLFAQGQKIQNERRMVGIVGTRKATEHGKEMVRRFIKDISPYDPIILSGLAYGIDITAHRSALENGLKNISILGSGLNHIYPQAHQKTASQIAENGLVMTEQLHNKKPDRENFPMRNRILAGLCDALVVVESGRKGGSMITAKLANEYHRDVFAFPGRPSDKMSKGCNLLLKSHRAQMIESVKDLVYITQWEKAENQAGTQRKLFVELSPEEKELIHIFNRNKELTIEKLAVESKLSVSRLSSILLNLEFKGMVKSLPGSRYLYIN